MKIKFEVDRRPGGFLVMEDVEEVLQICRDTEGYYLISLENQPEAA